MIREVDRPVNVLALEGVPAVAELAEAGVARISVGGSRVRRPGGGRQRRQRTARAGTYGFRRPVPPVPPRRRAFS